MSWSHFTLLIVIDDPLKRDFYTRMAQLESWSTRVVSERINAMLFERTALSKKPEETIRLEHKNKRLAKLQTCPKSLLNPPFSQ